MAEISIGYGQKVYLEDRGEHLVIGLRNHDGEPLAEIGMLPGEFDLLWDAYRGEQERVDVQTIAPDLDTSPAPAKPLGMTARTGSEP